MASFDTHLAAGMLTSGLLATAGSAAGLTSPADAIALWAVGSLGAVLPDIDADQSQALRLIFGLLGVGASAAVLSGLDQGLSIIELWLAAVGAWIGVRFGLMRVFAAFTVHRGVWHTLLAAAALTLASAHLTVWLFERGPRFAWLVGGFAGIGFVLHLLLDELYSVDLMNQTIKRSFGTALKMFDRNNPGASGLMALTVVGLAWTAPSPKPLWRALTHPATLKRVESQLWPTSARTVQGLPEALRVSPASSTDEPTTERLDAGVPTTDQGLQRDARSEVMRSHTDTDPDGSVRHSPEIQDHRSAIEPVP